MCSSKSTRDEKADKLLVDVVRDICVAVNSPKSLAVWLLFVSKEHQQLLEIECDPLNYVDSQSFADDYLVSSMLKKYPYLNTGIDTKSVAIQKFLDCEEVCRVANTKLRLQPLKGVHAAIMHRARKICEKVLGGSYVKRGPFTGQSISEEFFFGGGWGNGVTSSVKGKHLSGYNKLQGNLVATPDLITVGADKLVNSIPMWATYHCSGNPELLGSVTPNAITSVPGNTVTFVAKNAKTDRPIAIEPHLNAFLQRGIGKAISARLRRVGINLRDQTRNQQLALLGSRDGSVATIDLSSASDTVNRGIVETLIPSDWLKWLEVCRSPCYKLPGGKWKPYHKFSSMGNGYTFELETLVFYSLAMATCAEIGTPTELVSVYGDDIIVPTQSADLLLEVLNACGFSVNREKTFTYGPFRESCGKDYFHGVPVRPFFIRERLSSTAAIYRLANAIRRYSAMRCSSIACDGRFLLCWRRLYLSVGPRDRACRIPDGVGDGGFIGNFDECAIALDTIRRDWKRDVDGKRKPARVRRTILGFSFRARVERPIQRRKRDATVTVASALWDYLDLDTGSVDPVGVALDRSLYNLSKATTSRDSQLRIWSWPELGPWV